MFIKILIYTWLLSRYTFLSYCFYYLFLQKLKPMKKNTNYDYLSCNIQYLWMDSQIFMNTGSRSEEPRAADYCSVADWNWAQSKQQPLPTVPLL